MEKHLKKLPADMLELLYLARDVADRMGVAVFLVGGPVRDLIMESRTFDLDLTVEGDGIAFAEAYARALKVSFVAHRRFGTATVAVSSQRKVDVASTRRESYAAPGALPEVKAGSIEQDLARRDFTINTLALRLNRRKFGELMDRFNGRRDIACRTIRILHDRSFLDDPTRILRGIRFEQRYDFHIEPRTLSRLKAAVAENMLLNVEPQRLRDELVLLCRERKPFKAIKRLQVLAGLAFIHPRLSLSAQSQYLFAQVERQVSWCENRLQHHRQVDVWLVYFLALLDGLAVHDVRQVCERFALHARDRKRLLAYAVSGSRVIEALKKKDRKPSEVYHLLDPLSLEVILVLKAAAREKAVQRYIELFLTRYSGTRLSIGGDVLSGLGLPPGPQYQHVLRKVLDAKLNHQVASRQEELSLVRELMRTL